jgi:hypothetical protein
MCITRTQTDARPSAVISRLLSPRERALIAESKEVCSEVRLFIQAFLDARGRAMPPPPRPRVPPPRTEESQEESQDYEDEDLDLAALEVAMAGLDQTANPYKEKDEQVGKVRYVVCNPENMGAHEVLTRSCMTFSSRRCTCSYASILIHHRHRRTRRWMHTMRLTLGSMSGSAVQTLQYTTGSG